MTSLGVAERTERVEGRQSEMGGGGEEKAPVSGFLQEPRASQTLSKCIVLAQLLLAKCNDGGRGMEAQRRQSPGRG